MRFTVLGLVVWLVVVVGCSSEVRGQGESPCASAFAGTWALNDAVKENKCSDKVSDRALSSTADRSLSAWKDETGDTFDVQPNAACTEASLHQAAQPFGEAGDFIVTRSRAFTVERAGLLHGVLTEYYYSAAEYNAGNLTPLCTVTWTTVALRTAQ